MSVLFINYFVIIIWTLLLLLAMYGFILGVVENFLTKSRYTLKNPHIMVTFYCLYTQVS